MAAYDMLLNAIRDNGIFERNKIPFETKVLACLLYLSGLSYRAITLQTGIIRACYRSVHYWVQKFRRITSRVQKRCKSYSCHRWNQAKGEWYSAIRMGCYRPRYQGAVSCICFIPEVIYQCYVVCKNGYEYMHE